MCGLLYDGLMIQYPVHDICWYLARTSERTRADIELLEFGQTDRRARVSGWDLLADSKRGSDPKVCVILAPLVQVTVTDVFHSFRLNHSSSTRDLTCCRYQVPFPVFFFFSLCSCSCNSWLQTPTLNPPARYPSQREFAPTTFTEENIAQRFAQSKLVTTCQFDEPLAGSKKTPNHLPMDEQQWTPVQVLFFGGFLATRLDRTLRLAGRGRCSWLTSGVCRMCLMDQRFAKFKGH